MKQGQAVVDPVSLASVTVTVDTLLYPPSPLDLAEEIVWKGAPFTASVISLVNPVLTIPRSYVKPAEVTLGVGELDSDCGSTRRAPAASDRFGTRNDLTAQECAFYWCSRLTADSTFKIARADTFCGKCPASFTKTSSVGTVLFEGTCRAPIKYDVVAGSVKLLVRPAGIAMAVGSTQLRYGHTYDSVPKFIASDHFPDVTVTLTVSATASLNELRTMYTTLLLGRLW